MKKLISIFIRPLQIFLLNFLKVSLIWPKNLFPNVLLKIQSKYLDLKYLQNKPCKSTLPIKYFSVKKPSFISPSEHFSIIFFSSYRKRPTIKQCLAHRWLTTEEEPPSPSPLMLKIPEPRLQAPDLSEPVHKSSHGHGSGSSGSLGVGHHGPSGSRRYA